MSRVAKKPVTLPKGVDAKIDGEVLVIKGPKGSLEQIVPSVVEVAIENSEIRFSANDDEHVKLAGTLRALANNMVIGVSQGFERKLQ
ncbi:MAG: 50S ribosomal protein L6, partial [Halothiobacillaceae bacterium]|nr:50S ribosomal protein L6 [Halothiobacillaceae bacterium]